MRITTFNAKECSMSTLKNKSGLTEAEVQSAEEFADAAQYLAGGRASESE